MALAKPLTTIFQYIEENQENFSERLKNAIAIQSVPTSETNILDMINWTNNLLNSFEVQTEFRNIYEDSNSGQTPLPPILLGNLERGYCPNKATVLIYGHLDVKDAQKDDGWKNEPFELFEDDGFLYGRGVLNKCPLAAWINALEAYHSSGIDFPVNIKFIFESLGTQSSPGLKEILLAEKDKFLANVDYICISEGTWLQPEIPCLIKSTKGICCFLIEVESAVKNLDSDICGGMVQEAMTDLLFLLQSLVDEKGNLNISSTQLDTTISDDDLQIYETANFNLNNFLNSIGAHSPSQIGDKREILKHKLNLPTITIHDIKTSCTESTDSEIPGSVTAKLSIRTVHSQKAEKVFESIQQYLQNVWSQKGSQNKMKITLEKSLNGWHSDIDHDHIQVGVKALNYVYDVEPWFLNSGYHMPAVNILSDVLKRNIIVLPLGSGENYDINENFQCLNYYNSSKVLSAYLYEMGELPRLLSESSSSFTSCTSCPSVAEACVCGRFLEKVEPASGDTENCICSDGVCSPKSTSDLKEVTKDELKPDALVYRNDREPIIEGVIVDEPITEEEEISEEDESEKSIGEEESKSRSPLLSKICECPPLIFLESSPKEMVGEIISLTSNASVLSRDPTPVTEPEKPKKDIVPSVETLRCFCTPKMYRNLIRQKSITPEEQHELMKSMRSVGSEGTGISAGESQPDLKTTKTVTMGCVCPEKSADTVFEQSRQIERMLCPVKTTKKEETCTKGGKRKHRIIGPAPVEGDSEISLGPVSHCSCSSEELIVVTCCDCDTKKSNHDAGKKIPKEIPEAIPKEILQEIPQEMSKEIPDEIPKEIPQDIPEEIPKEVPEEIAKEIPQEIPAEIPEEIPNEIIEDIPKEIPQEIPKEVPQEIPLEIPNEIQPPNNLEEEVD